MKYTLLTIACLSLLVFTQCKDEGNDEKMIPVEADNGIGDGAPSLDSLLKYQSPPIIDEKAADSLLNKTLKDSI